ncbi:MAG TPA: cytochrome c [Burkholderiales bacterium]|nr:cytochrome c [Burkholderiales bacterium]
MTRSRLVRPLLLFCGALALLGVGVAAFVWSGVYGIGADDPHAKPVEAALQRLRERSVAVRAKGIEVPSDLDHTKRVEAGAQHYAEMCAGCHLAPGITRSELREGLYPQPPSLVEASPRDSGSAFWIIKHGIKMSAMPAWGKSHDDEAIWSMVAFVRKLPTLSPADYRELAGQAGTNHVHGHTEPPHSAAHDASAPPTRASEPVTRKSGSHAHGHGQHHRH